MHGAERATVARQPLAPRATNVGRDAPRVASVDEQDERSPQHVGGELVERRQAMFTHVSPFDREQYDAPRRPSQYQRGMNSLPSDLGNSATARQNSLLH